jgi:hypothetical protein
MSTLQALLIPTMEISVQKDVVSAFRAPLPNKPLFHFTSPEEDSYRLNYRLIGVSTALVIKRRILDDFV